ncbi:MFS transporter [Mycobacterium sp.]|uniref:MFS transporter n=1 Tax=Mycobacterium sp. TaxID=1785 RepID=UPI0031D8FA11
MARRQRIAEWNPEDAAAWSGGASRIARRNLIWQVVNVHVTFSIFYLWSVMVLFMPREVYGFSTGDKLLLGATASLVGGLARFPYAMLGARFGGRNWTVISSLVLLIPTIGTMVLLAHPGLPLWPYLVCAALTGLGGGNYTSSMANAEGFYPQRLKGLALGLTGGLANLGSAAVQMVGLVVLATAGHKAPYLVCSFYLVLLAVGGLGAALFMDNMYYRIDMSHLRAALKIPDSWGVALLYLCASGSFLGFAFAFGQVLEHNFVISGQSHGQAALHAAQVAFIGPLLGSIARVAGGLVSDRLGGGRVTVAVFGASVLAGAFLVAVSISDDLTRHVGDPVATYTTVGYVIGFVALFIFCGAAKGAVYKLIPTIFEARSHALNLGDPERRHWARVMSGTLIGFAGAFGALGGVGINLVLRQSYVSAGTETPAFWIFLLCYIGATTFAWLRYVRPRRAGGSAPETAVSWSDSAAAVESVSR